MKTKKTRRSPMMKPEPAKALTPRRGPMPPPHPAKLLTRREIEVVRLLAGGLRNREIGKKLLISEGTVKIHLHNIFSKLHLESRLALGIYAKEKKLI